MFVTSHVLAGAVIGRALSRHPFGALVAGVVSHLGMDACPHWGLPEGSDPELFLRVARCDGCAGLAAMAVSAGLSPGRSRRAVLAAMVGGALPDLDKPMRHYFGIDPYPKAFTAFHVRIQDESPKRLPHELAVAAALAVAAVVVLRRP